MIHYENEIAKFYDESNMPSLINIMLKYTMDYFISKEKGSKVSGGGASVTYKDRVFTINSSGKGMFATEQEGLSS